MKKRRKVRWKWDYDSNRKHRVDQILVIEGMIFGIEDLMEGIDKNVIKVIKKVPEVSHLSNEIKEIMDNFLFDVYETKDLKWK